MRVISMGRRIVVLGGMSVAAIASEYGRSHTSRSTVCLAGPMDAAAEVQ